MKTKNITLLFAAIVAIIGLMVAPRLFGGGEQAALTLNIAEDENIKGNADAGLTLVEYSDFECPACGAYFPIVKAVTEEFEEDVRFVYRHFPLVNAHPYATLAAAAAEAADRQGKFWEMHNMIFENQRTWSGSANARDIFIGYAEELGLPREQFVRDLDDTATTALVEDDFREGLSLGVNSTPTFFLNGKRIQPRGLDDFREEIQDALQDTEKNPAGV